MCLRCPPPRWTSAKGSSDCDACRSRHYLANTIEGSSKPGTWGTEMGDNSEEMRHCERNKVGDSSACCECPTGATCKLGSTIESVRIKEGFYRHSRASAQTFECRHPKACAGTSTDPQSDDVEDMRLEGDELCRVGFTGESWSACVSRPSSKQVNLLIWFNSLFMV